MLTITFNSYDESNDTFTCSAAQDLSPVSFGIELPAVVVPYLAPELVAQCDDLPFDLVGKAVKVALPAALHQAV